MEVLVWEAGGGMGEFEMMLSVAYLWAVGGHGRVSDGNRTGLFGKNKRVVNKICGSAKAFNGDGNGNTLSSKSLLFPSTF